MDRVSSPRAAVDGADWRVCSRRWSRALSRAAMRRPEHRRHTSRLAVHERDGGVGRHSRGHRWRNTSEWIASARRALRSTALIGRALSSMVARALFRRDASLGASSMHIAPRGGRTWRRHRSTQPRSQSTRHVRLDRVGSPRPAVDGANWRACSRRWSRALNRAAMRRSRRRCHTSHLAADERGGDVGRHRRGHSWRVTSEWAASARCALRPTALIGARALVDGRARSLAPRRVDRGAVDARCVSR